MIEQEKNNKYINVVTTKVTIKTTPKSDGTGALQGLEKKSKISR